MNVALRSHYAEREARSEALRRVRLAAPTAAVLLPIGLAASPIIGVERVTGVLVVNAVAIALCVALSYLAWTRRLPEASWHAAAVLTWLALPVTTLATLVFVGHGGLVAPLIGALFAAPLVIVHRTGLVVTTCLVAGAWWLVAPPSDADVSLELARAAMVGSLGLANLAGFFSSRAVLDGANLRAELHAANNQLKRELRQRRTTERERETFRDQFMAAQRNEAIGSLAAGLAHEMNNILAGVLTSAELLADDAPDEATARAAAAIAREAQRGGALTRSLLAFSRRGQYQRAPTRLDDMVEEVRRVLPRTLKRTITLGHAYSSDAVVDVDRAQLIQAILNLGINGADAMTDGGTLRLTTERETLTDEHAARIGLSPATYAVVSVTDTGHGMDSTTRRRAFEPFYTTKPLGKGTGLGLAMVDGSVRAHGGSLEVQSVLGRGTTIRLYLPIHEGPAADAIAPTPLSELRGGRVLLIDDEALVRSALAKALRRVGLEVICARDGAEGLATFSKTDGIVLVVCDVNMPAMDGTACVRAIRKRSDVPVIIVSGYATEAEAGGLMSEGLAQRFVEKPFSRRAFLDVVDGVLAKKDTSRHVLAPR